MFCKSKLVLIGKVAGTHGIKGLLRVLPYSGDTQSIMAHRVLILKGSNGESGSFNVTNSSIHGKFVLVSLGSCNDINEVQHLVGREVYVKREQLPELDDGEYYWCDLIGMKVMTVHGDYLGDLANILATGNHDVYLVKAGNKEYLIPAVEDIITHINFDDNTITVDPPEGLLDL